MTEDTVVYNLRSIDRSVRDRISRAASSRGLSQAEYLSRLIDLHDAIRARADAGDDALTRELVSLGLETVVN